MADSNPLTPEELARIEAEPDLLAVDPDLQSRYDQTIATRYAEEPPPEVHPDASPPPEAPPAAASSDAAAPPAPDAPKGPPEYLNDVSPEDREKLLLAWYNELPEDKRQNFPPVQQMLRDAAAAAETRGEERGRQSAVTRNTEAELSTLEQTLLEDPTPANATKYREMSHQHGFESAGAEMSQGFNTLLRDLKLGGLPPEVNRRVADAKNLAEQVYVVSRYVADAVFNAGTETGKKSGAAVSEADQIVMRAKLRNEAIAEAAKNGRLRIGQDADGFFAEFIKDNVPPVLSSVASTPTSVNLTEEDFARYQRMVVEDPLNIPADLQAKVDAALASAPRR